MDDIVIKGQKSQLGLISASQVRQVEKQLIDSGVSGFELMEKAGRGLAEFIMNNFAHSTVVILCGPGNNGGDGFVAARILDQAGWLVRLYCVKQSIMFQSIAKEAADRWHGDVSLLSEIEVSDGDIVVDAIYGNGLNGPLSEEIIQTFNAVRQERVKIIAVDVPSGLSGAQLSVDRNILKADYTVTTTRPRLEHVLQPCAQYCGQLHVVDIGIKPSAFAGMAVPAYINAPSLWRDFWKVPDSMTHKYIRGHVGVLGGTELTGAARLAVHGAMRIGAGVGTIVTTRKAAKIYQSIVAPEIMVRGFDDPKGAADFMNERHVSVALIGPGADEALGMELLAKHCMKHHMQIVLDGDALGRVPVDYAHVITPHEGEFSRMFPHLAEIPNKLERTKKAAVEADCVVVLKGMDTIIASPEGRAYINNTASPWLSTAGSGDVLAGAVAGCLAQKIPPFEAACSAVWIHGAASLKCGPGMLASELPPAIGKTLSEVYGL